MIIYLNHSYSHHLFYLFYLLLFFHSFGCFVKSINGTCKGYNSNIFTIPVFLIVIIDRLVRISRAREDTYIGNVIVHPAKVIELQIEKPTMQFIPGQYLYVNIPSISKFQWHPFTITSSPQDGFISLHIKVVGDWTENLLNQVKSEIPKILIDGPYGAPAQDLFNFRISVIISAGIGLTPAS